MIITFEAEVVALEKRDDHIWTKVHFKTGEGGGDYENIWIKSGQFVLGQPVFVVVEGPKMALRAPTRIAQSLVLCAKLGQVL